jgi:hypothetical protein
MIAMGNGRRVDCSREDIVDGIIDALKPWHKARSRKKIQAIVLLQIDDLTNSVAAGWQPTNALKETVEKLEKPVDSLIKALDEIPPKSLLGNMVSRHTFPGALRDFRAWQNHLKRILPSGNTDIIKRACAATAFTIITAGSAKRPTKTADGPMRTIASLLYELIKGERGANMKRACDMCLDTMWEQEEAGIAAASPKARSLLAERQHGDRQPVLPRQQQTSRKDQRHND